MSSLQACNFSVMVKQFGTADGSVTDSVPARETPETETLGANTVTDTGMDSPDPDTEGSDAASGDSGPLGKESGVLGVDSGLLVEAELSVGVAGVGS
nr:hypothetical protein Iba_chr09bCG12320 [Ipomoea batatas]